MHTTHRILAAAALAVVGAPALAGDAPVRFASYNCFLNRPAEGGLIDSLSTPDDAQAKAVAEILQRNRPDVVLLNEFDFDANGEAIALFQQNYLSVSQNGADPIDYPFVFLAPSNTGIASGFDFNNDGMIVTTPGEFGYGDDCFGFGFFPGQFAQVLLSQHPINVDDARTFQNFLWADMPGALLPDDPDTPEPADWYSPEELAVFRLSSKSHWDVPIQIGDEVVHVLCAHPTPPVFDGPEDRNGLRNADEIRLFADYVTPGAGGYIVDDKGGRGGLTPGAKFVILGDYNADPRDGDGVDGAIHQLLGNPLIQDPRPASRGGYEAALFQAGRNLEQIGNPKHDTGDFTDVAKAFTPAGNLRADYALPSFNLAVAESGVFWPAEGEPFFDLVGAGDPMNGNNVVSSDHRLVYVDVAFGPAPLAPAPCDLGFTLEFIGEATFPTGFMFEGTEVGGLSAILYDADIDLYLALSDDRSQFNDARAYSLTIDLADGALADGDVEFRQLITLTDENGDPFAPFSLDPEGLALNADGTLFLASEGDANNDIDPFVNRFSAVGRQFEVLDVPAKFLTGTPGFGIRNNLAFESMTVTPDGAQAVTATENALAQDGPTASVDAGSPSRILTYDAASGRPGAEYVYVTEPVAAESIPPGEFKTNGLVELLALDAGDLLAVERSFSVGVGNAIKLFRASLAGADDVAGVEALGGDEAPVSKDLVLDLADLGLTLDNIEGVAFGPDLPDGRRALILVSDNNFNANGQFTQFLAFAVTPNAGDGFDSADLNELLAQFGQTGELSADLNQDGAVDTLDLNILLLGFCQ